MQTLPDNFHQQRLVQIAKLTRHDHLGEVLVLDDELHAMILDDLNAGDEMGNY